MAKQELEKVKQLADDNPDLATAGLSDEVLDEMKQCIESMPAAAVQVLKYATFSPFSAIGIPRLQQARVLNTVNKRQMLKSYRKLALQLHPDKSDHPMALPAMQALNAAYDKTQIDPNAPKARPKPAPKRPGHRR